MMEIQKESYLVAIDPSTGVEVFLGSMGNLSPIAGIAGPWKAGMDCNTNEIPDACERLTVGVPALLVCSKFGDSVSAYDGATGQRLGYAMPPGINGLDYANGMMMDSSGDFYVASVFTHSVLHFSGKTGELIRELGRPVCSGTSRCLDPGFKPLAAQRLCNQQHRVSSI
jgi:hypothetical protein